MPEKTMNVLSLFSGIQTGGLELGLERAGMTVVGQVEIDPFCRSVLAKHWPEVPKHDDVRTAVDWWRSEPRPAVHVVAGGFPCQPVSLAGRGRAQEDDRWLWPEMAEVINTLRPGWVVGENVPGLRTRGLDIVLADLRRLGYAARAGYIGACEVGAPHPRRRLFVLAHSLRSGRQERCPASRRDGYREARPAREAGGGPCACRIRLVGDRTRRGSSGLWGSRRDGPTSSPRQRRRAPSRRAHRTTDRRRQPRERCRRMNAHAITPSKPIPDRRSDPMDDAAQNYVNTHPGSSVCWACDGTGVADYDDNDGSVINRCDRCGGSGVIPADSGEGGDA